MVRLYDTLTRETKPLVAGDGSTFRFYCCGPTVYGPAHIGNFRTFVVQDTLRRAVEASGLTTLHVRNLTDVDDKTIRQSRAENRTLGEFTREWTRRFHEDCRALNLLSPHQEPGAVGHIDEQIALIRELLDRGHAYVKGGSVYFRVSSFPGYGRLSRLHEREITTGSREPGGEGVEADEYVRESAVDFALWKARKPEDGENFWPSPWGEGRPGWHIECSAMSLKYCGPDFDLHGGGVDLIFPHHENEIAQSECATGVTFARHWMHVAHLMVDGSKMSKSLGNLYTLADVMERGFDAPTLRLALISGQYRQPLNFTWESMVAARGALGRLAKARAAFGATHSAIAGDWDIFKPFWVALCEDLNVPAALGRVFSVLNEVGDIATMNDAARLSAGVAFERVLRVLGLETIAAADAAAVPVPADVRAVAEQRWAARQRKDWAEADRLRNQLATLGWAMKDGRNAYELIRQTA